MNALDQALAGRSGWVLDPNADPPDATRGHPAERERAVRAGGLPDRGRLPDALAARFGAGLRLVDYRADPDGARRLINAWVATERNGGSRSS